MAAGFLLAGLVVAANVLIDPQQVFGTGLISVHTNYNSRFVHYLVYKSNASAFDGVLFASSRGGGIPLDALTARTGAVYAPFIATHGLITDHLPTLEFVIKDQATRGRRLREVFLLLDSDFFGDQPDTNRTIQGYLHPDISGEDRSRFWLRYLTAVQPTSWWADLAPLWRDMTRSAPKRARTSHRFEGQTVQAAVGPGQINPPFRPRPDLIAGLRRPDYARQLALLQQFVSLCRDNEIHLVVALSPMNARANSAARNVAEIARVVDDLAKITPVWEFGAPDWLADRTDLWFDASHFDRAVGRMMLARIFEGAAPDNGASFGVLRGSK